MPPSPPPNLSPYTSSSAPRLRAPLRLPPPINTMAPATTADRDSAELSFMQQYELLSALKDVTIEAEPAERKKAAQDLLQGIVS